MSHDAPSLTPVVDLVFPEWEGNAKGRETREMILRAALAILIEEGYRAMSMRRVAAMCNLPFGNLTYHYRSYEDLVTELLEAVIRSYEVAGEIFIKLRSVPAEDRLVRLCQAALEDIRSKKTTRLFPELWAISNHDPFVFKRMHELYRRARLPLEEIIEEMRPDLSRDQRASLALFISASIEGMTVFAGHEKPFSSWMPSIERMAAKSFVELVKSASAEEIGELAPLPSAVTKA